MIFLSPFGHMAINNVQSADATARVTWPNSTPTIKGKEQVILFSAGAAFL